MCISVGNTVTLTDVNETYGLQCSRQCERLAQRSSCAVRNPNLLSGECLCVCVCAVQRLRIQAYSLIHIEQKQSVELKWSGHNDPPLVAAHAISNTSDGTTKPVFTHGQLSPLLPPHLPSSLTQTQLITKEPVRISTPLLGCMHTQTKTNPCPMFCHRLWGYPARTIGPPKNSTVCLIFLYSSSFLHGTDDTMQWFTSSWALAYCRQPLLAHVWLAHSVGLIASKVNKIGDKNQF